MSRKIVEAQHYGDRLSRHELMTIFRNKRRGIGLADEGLWLLPAEIINVSETEATIEPRTIKFRAKYCRVSFPQMEP